MKKCIYVLISVLVFYFSTLPVGSDMEIIPLNQGLSYESSISEVESRELKKKPIKQKLTFFRNKKEDDKKNIRLSEEVRLTMMEEEENNYAYSRLEDIKREVYVEILYALSNRIEEIQLSAKDTELVDHVFQCVLMDHPEIFYTDGYSFVKYTLGDEIQKIIFQGNYIYDEEEILARQLMIEKEADDIISMISEEATDYDKVKYIYDTIISNTEYSMEADDNQNICSVFIGKASVCQGYAKAMQYLLNKMSVPTTIIVGTVDNGEGHAWNLVEIDGNYYFVDATWGDASYLIQKEDSGMEEVPSINYNYLCITTEELENTHKIEHLVAVPECTAKKANYYVVEGAYFTEFNEEQLAGIIEKYRVEGRESITLKCADETVYREMSDILLEEQAIFHYLEGEDNSIVYTDSKEHLCLTFYL